MRKRAETTLVTPRQAVILFADLMNSSLFSDTLGLYEYDVLIENFQKAMDRAKDNVFWYTSIDKSQVEFSIRGDEAVAILYSEDIRRDLHTALMLAFYMKTMWFQSSFNIERLSEAKIASDIGIGIHTGKVIVRPRLAKTKQPKAEGYAINLAKRIEELSRKGSNWKIMISSEIRTLLKKFAFDIDLSEKITEQLKGILNPINAYEILNFPEELYPIVILIGDKNIDLFISVYEANPEDWLATYIIVALHFFGSFRKAIEFIKTHDLQNHKHWRIQHYYLRLSRDLGQYDAALEVHKKIGSMFPSKKDEVYDFEEGMLIALRGELDEAIAIIEKSIRSGYQYPYAYEVLGKSYLRKLKSDPKLSETDIEYCINKSHECFGKAVEKLEDEEAIFFLGLIYAIKKNSEKSNTYFKQCYDLLKDRIKRFRPASVHDILQLKRAGYCCIKLGMEEQGRKYLIKAIKCAEKMENNMALYSYQNLQHIDNTQFVEECKSLIK